MAATSEVSWPEIKADWEEDVQNLLQKTAEWSQQGGWNVTWETVDIDESDLIRSGPEKYNLNHYSLPVLVIDRPEGRLIVEPRARVILGAEGRVDFYAWPTLTRVMLLRRGKGQWVVRTDSGINWPEPWNQAAFEHLGRSLLAEE